MGRPCRICGDPIDGIDDHELCPECYGDWVGEYQDTDQEPPDDE